MRPIFRFYVACLLAISLIVVSAAAFAPAHLHAGVKSDACAVCKASETPIVSTRAVVAVWPPSPICEYIQACGFDVSAEGVTGSIRSRAPPVL
jgi:hypothetical protein